MQEYRPMIMCALTQTQHEALIRAIDVLSSNEDDLVHVGPLHILAMEYEKELNLYREMRGSV